MKKPKRIDLHIHTILSEGDLTASQQFSFAAGSGISAIAITDRDVLPDVESMEAFSRHSGVQFIPGIEITAGWKGHETHILGYNIDCEHSGLSRKLSLIRASKEAHLEIMVQKLGKVGVRLSMNDVRETAPHDTPLGSIHIAKALVAHGYVRALREAFTERLIGVDGDCYFPTSSVSALEIIELIQSAGGISVVAHPGIHNHHCGFDEGEIASMKEAGLKGIEVLHPCHTSEDEKRYASMARTLDLAVVGGSGCRGPNYDRLVKYRVEIPEEMLHTVWRPAVAA